MEHGRIDEDQWGPADDWDLSVPSGSDASVPADMPQEECAKNAFEKAKPHHASGLAKGQAASAQRGDGLPEPSPTPAAKARGQLGKAGFRPAIAARSGLFRIGRHGASAPIHSGPVPSQGSYGLSLFGPWPRMTDKPVWEAAIDLAREQPDPAEEFSISLSEFASRMGKTDTGGTALNSIWQSLERLAACHVDLHSPMGTRIGGKLLKAATKSGRSRSIQIDWLLAEPLFREDYQFKIDGPRRGALDCSLSKWLHDFLSTHEAGDKLLTVGYLRRMCGHGGEPRHFTSLLRQALLELAQKAPGLVLSHSIEELGRSSDRWRIELVRGPDSPVFEKPKRRQANDGLGQSASARRRAGPAL